MHNSWLPAAGASELEQGVVPGAIALGAPGLPGYAGHAYGGLDFNSIPPSACSGLSPLEATRPATAQGAPSAGAQRP